MRLFFTVTGMVILLAVVGCNTYTMTTSQLQQQLAKIDTASIHKQYNNSFLPLSTLWLMNRTKGGSPYNGLTTVFCTDSKGKSWRFNVNPNTQIRLSAGKRRDIFYYDSLELLDSMVYGDKSRFIPIKTKPYALHELTKIELQFRFSSKLAAGEVH